MQVFSSIRSRSFLAAYGGDLGCKLPSVVFSVVPKVKLNILNVNISFFLSFFQVLNIFTYK
jgi:hypothetical protein